MICGSCFSEVKEPIYCSVCKTPLHKECAIKDDGFYCDDCYTLKDSEIPQIDVPDVIRRSYIETYKVCPLKAYYVLLKGIKAPPNAYTQIGIDLHELFSKASLDDNYTKSEMLDEFHKTWYNYNPSLFENDEEFKEKMHIRATTSINNIYNILPNMRKVVSAEETIQFPIGENLPYVQTTSDRINSYKDGLEIIDWKTGAVMVGQKISSDLQAPLYIYGVQQHYNKPVYRFVFHYLNEGKERVFERVEGDKYVCTVGKRNYQITLRNTIHEVQSIFGKIKKGVFNVPTNTKKMFFTCKMCHLKDMEICKGAYLESWHQAQGR